MTDAEKLINKVIKDVAVENKFGNYELKVDPISSGGANYTSTLYNVTVKNEDKTHHLFAKIAAMGEKARSEGPRFYHIEIYVYTKLRNVYEDLQDRFQLPQEHRLSLSKFYGCNPTLLEETLVLEDLATQGYQSYDRFKSVDWEYSVASLTEMAKLHALSFAYSEYHPEDFKETLKEVKFEWDMVNGPIVGYFKMMSSRAINKVQEKDKDKVKKFFEKFEPEKFMQLFKETLRPVLVHGDFRSSNLMYKIREDGTVDIKVLDLQTMQAASPVVDFLYFMFTGSDQQFRAQYYEKLVDFYYTELAAAMKRLHLDPEQVYSRIDFDYELKKKLPFGLSIAVFTLPIVTVATEDAPQVNEDMDLSAFSSGKTSDLYSERLNGIVNDYVNWGILK